MVWKQDLAKLKHQFKEEDPKPKVPQRIALKPMEPSNLSIEEQDSLFLNAMGRRAVQQASQKAKVPQAEEMVTPVEDNAPVAALPAEDFQAAMGGLKGIKPLMPKIPVVEVKAEPLAVPLALAPEAPTAVPVVEIPAEPALPITAQLRPMPERINLAAGMAIEVDGTLDLRGHTTVDAMERFRERLQDGVFLGWRTFHVLFGASEELEGAFQVFLASHEARVIARFAQAPIPMGGSHAWILYYAPPGH